MATRPDDSFELYDLKVEVVGPEGARLYCGAKIGDYFELHGEMLYLPQGQGISIYSLSSVLPLLAAKQRVTSHMIGCQRMPRLPVQTPIAQAGCALPDSAKGVSAIRKRRPSPLEWMQNLDTWRNF